MIAAGKPPSWFKPMGVSSASTYTHTHTYLRKMHSELHQCVASVNPLEFGFARAREKGVDDLTGRKRNVVQGEGRCAYIN